MLGVWDKTKRVCKSINVILEGPGPEVGEIWRFVYRHGNPWKEDYVSDWEITDKKEGWVRYKSLVDGSIGESSIGIFRESHFKVEKE